MKWINLLLICGVVAGLYGCDKPEPAKEWSVNYRVLVFSQPIPSYRVTYQTQNQSSKTIGTLKEDLWTSETLSNFTSGSAVNMRIEILSGSGEMEIQILRNNAVHESSKLPIGVNEWEISGIL